MRKVKIITTPKRSSLWQSWPGNVDLNCWRQTNITLSPAAIVLKSLVVISFLSKKCEGATPTLFQWIDWIRQKSFHSQTKYRPFHRSACDGTRRREGRHKKRPWGGWLRPPFAMKKKKSLFPPPSFSYVFGTGKTGLTNEKKILSKSHNSILNHYREMDGLECRLN